MLKLRKQEQRISNERTPCSTGRSQAPHLHYEVFKDGDRINPVNFYYGNLSPEEFNELLAKASLENQSLD